METPEVALSDREAQVYDRQLRIWGVETQKRLSNARVLIYGLNGLAAEVAKNIVLAGVGSVTLADDTPVARAPPANFLVHAQSPDGSVADASVATLQEMNPFVKVVALPGGLEAALARDTLARHDLLLLSAQPEHVVRRADEACTAAGVGLFAAGSQGIFGWLFINLHQHQYSVETQTEQADGSVSKATTSHTSSYPTWQQAMECSLAGVNMRRTSKLYFVLRVCAELEQAEQRRATAADTPALLELKQQLCVAHGLDGAAVDDNMIESYAAATEDMPAVNAVLGGVVANELVKAVSAKGAPLNNLFLFALTDGMGAVEQFG